jgi:hypothetical protein
MELLGKPRRRKETWASSYFKIRIGQGLLLHGSKYVHLRTIVYIPIFTYLFLLPKSHFLPLNHIQCLSFHPLSIFRLSVHCTSNHHSHWRANKSFGRYQNCLYVSHSKKSVTESISWARRILSTCSCPATLRFILILYSRLHLGLPEEFFVRNFCMKLYHLSCEINSLPNSCYLIDLIILLPRKLSKGFGDFKIVAEVIHTVKYADDLVLLVKEQTVLQCIIDTLTKIGRRCGMEMSVLKRESQSNHPQCKSYKLWCNVVWYM